MKPEQRFRVLAILFGELAKIPGYDAEGNRLYQRLRRGRVDTHGADGQARPRQAVSGGNSRAVRGLKPAGLTSL